MTGAPPQVQVPQVQVRTAILVFLAALSIRVLFCFVAVPLLNLKTGPAQPDFYDSTDGYINIAQTLAEHGRYAFSADAPLTTYRAPMFPFAIAAVYAVVKNIGTAVLLVNCVTSALTCLIVFDLARRVIPRPITVRFMSAAILFPLSIYYCASSFSDTFVAFTVSLYVLSLIRLVQSPSLRTAASCGIAFAVAALTKAVVVPIPALICGLMLIRHRSALRPAFVSAMIGFGLVGLWTVRNYAATDRFVLITGGSGYNALVGNYMIDEWTDCDTSLAYGRAKAREFIESSTGRRVDTAELRPAGFLDIPPEIDRAYGDAAFKMMTKSPLLTMRKLAINSLRFWYFSSGPTKSIANAVVNGSTLLLAILALPLLLRQRRVEAEMIGLFVVSSVVLYSLIIVHSSRFCLPMVMVLTPLAAHGLVQLLAYSRSGRISALASPARQE